MAICRRSTRRNSSSITIDFNKLYRCFISVLLSGGKAEEAQEARGKRVNHSNWKNKDERLVSELAPPQPAVGREYQFWRVLRRGGKHPPFPIGLGPQMQIFDVVGSHAGRHDNGPRVGVLGVVWLFGWNGGGGSLLGKYHRFLWNHRFVSSRTVVGISQDLAKTNTDRRTPQTLNVKVPVPRDVELKLVVLVDKEKNSPRRN